MTGLTVLIVGAGALLFFAGIAVAARLIDRPERITQEDRDTLAWARSLRPRPARTALALRARITVLRALTTAVQAPPIVPGRRTPASPTAPMPPHLGGGDAEAHPPAGGSSLAPGPEPSATARAPTMGAVATGREPAPPLPDTVTAALAELAGTVTELARPSDEEAFPHLIATWEDDTGSFAAFIEDGAQ